MDMKEKISELIYNHLDYAYCDNCRGNDINNLDDDFCDNCHRKFQNWGIRKCTADEIADEILTTIKGDESKCLRK